jgi:hypothetical protein
MQSPTITSIAPQASLPVSALDLVLRRLATEHDSHRTGAVLPCPICFGIESPTAAPVNDDVAAPLAA